jgi:hypothetical protein
VQVVAAASSPPPLLLPLPPLLLASSVVPASTGGVAGVLLELQATAKATAAEPETAHKMIEFFILKNVPPQSGRLAVCKLPASGPGWLSHVRPRCLNDAKKLQVRKVMPRPRPKDHGEL